MIDLSKIQEAKKLLKQYFGYDEFRQGQEQLIEAALNGQDVLGIMPTGAGKSLCFQIPTLMTSVIPSNIDDGWNYTCDLSTDLVDERSGWDTESSWNSCGIFK